MLGLAIACTVLTTVTADSPTAIPWDGRVSPSFRKEYEVLVNPDDVAAGTKREWRNQADWIALVAVPAEPLSLRPSTTSS
jgi:hypothetical protein